MWNEHDIALAIVYLLMLALAPFSFRIARLSVKYLYHRYFSIENIYVTYKQNGTVTARYKLMRKSDGSLREIKISKERKGANHE